MIFISLVYAAYVRIVINLKENYVAWRKHGLIRSYNKYLEEQKSFYPNLTNKYANLFV